MAFGAHGGRHAVGKRPSSPGRDVSGKRELYALGGAIGGSVHYFHAMVTQIHRPEAVPESGGNGMGRHGCGHRTPDRACRLPGCASATGKLARTQQFANGGRFLFCRLRALCFFIRACYTPSSSTSNNKVAFGGITPPAPPAP